ncbi:DUF488 family protein [Candidatus Saccharibacteria bacterium]|nr:DUF488 family protein [Candidatus Saccharibacteria bacterium]
MPHIQLKRIYEPYAPSDGYRVLVDRLWPRGVAKDEAKIDFWAKDIAPTTELREDFHSGHEDWPHFEHDYHGELAKNPAFADFVQQIEHEKTVTLLFAAKDTEHTHAKIILAALESKLH